MEGKGSLGCVSKLLTKVCCKTSENIVLLRNHEKTLFSTFLKVFYIIHSSSRLILDDKGCPCHYDKFLFFNLPSQKIATSTN